VYAAGDCTGVLMLASVAAMQGRIAMWHFLGDAVSPLDLKTVSSNVFTAPEIATVGWSQEAAGHILWAFGQVERVGGDGVAKPLAKGDAVFEGDVSLRTSHPEGFFQSIANVKDLGHTRVTKHGFHRTSSGSLGGYAFTCRSDGAPRLCQDSVHPIVGKIAALDAGQICGLASFLVTQPLQ